MNYKLLFLCLILSCVSLTASAQPKRKPAPAAKPAAARIMVEGFYEETFMGTTDEGNVEGKLIIEFQANRWVKIATNETGNAEFSDLPNAPAATVTGSVSYNGLLRGANMGADGHEANSSFSGKLEGADVFVSVPEYSKTAEGLRMTVRITPRLKGKCATDSVRGGDRTTSVDCYNGTFFFTPTTPLAITPNDDPASAGESANKATFGMELVVEPEIGGGGVDPETGTAVDEAARKSKEMDKAKELALAGAAGLHTWRGAVTNGSKESGFKITLERIKEVPSNDGRGTTRRKLIYTATIVPGSPGSTPAPDAPKKVDPPMP
ncbi:MAG: hypothetical protein ABI596_08625 [Pyrinomonadaceae bacterium]